MKRTVIGAGALMLMAGTASATTYTFNSGPAASPTLSGDIFTVSASSDGILNYEEPLVVQTPTGLGIQGGPDTQPGLIDGNPTFSSEALTVTFNYAVTLDSFTLFGIDWNDDYNIYLDGVLYADSATDSNVVIDQTVTSFTLEAKSSLGEDPFIIGSNGFKLASFTVSPVPVPAAAGLLASAIGALALLRRRRAAA